MGVWSNPVKGRDDAFQERNAENICGLVKARSLALGV